MISRFLKRHIPLQTKRLIKRILIEEHVLGKPTRVQEHTFYDGVLLGLLASSTRPIVLVQVGAHDGRHFDPLINFINSAATRLRAILIEPQPDVFADLVKLHGGNKSIVLLNQAINREETALSLYRIKPDARGRYRSRRGAEPTGITSVNKDFVLRKAISNLKVDAEEAQAYVEEISVPATSLKEVLKKYAISKLDILQVDTEGFDDEVIYSLPFAEASPTIVNFEHENLSDERLEALVGHLEAHRYKIYFWSRSDACAIQGKHSDFG